MKIRSLWAILGALTCAASAQAETVIVTADRMIDVLAGRAVENPVIVIADGRISHVGHDELIRAFPNTKRIDLPGKTLLPGLIDMHVHLDSDATLSGYRQLDYTNSFWQAVGVANAKKMLDAGFTTVRNVGSDGYNDVGLKQGIEAGYVPGPRIVPATFAIGATGGVLSRTDALGAQQFSLEEMKAIVDEAHMLGMKVAAHAHGTSGINDALRAGTDTIEHASLADEESFRLAKARGAWFSMDIYNDDYILAEGAKNGVYPESLEKERQIGRKQREVFRAAVKAGVKQIFGTDNGGVFPAGQNALQFAKEVEWGMTPMQAIQSATSNAAEALGRTGDVGAIAVGRYGDIVAVSGDPLSDIRVLEHVDVIIKGGEVVKKD